MSILAVAIVNSPLGPGFVAFWEAPLGFEFADARFRMSLAHWVNDGLLTIFFLLVGLEIKREFTVGRLANRRSAAFPIAAALGGMAVPAGLYALVIPAGAWSHGWGIPMATDTAFAIALIVMLGQRVPVELRVFLTAASIVDDIGAIVVVAFFYSGALHWAYLAGAAGIVVLLALLNRSGVYRAMPYGLLGIALWACVHAGGLHATLAGVLLALFIPTRPPPNLERADGAGERGAHRRDRARPGRAAPRPVGVRRCARSTRSTIASSRRPTARCARSSRGRASSCCRCSRCATRASRCRSACSPGTSR